MAIVFAAASNSRLPYFFIVIKLRPRFHLRGRIQKDINSTDKISIEYGMYRICDLYKTIMYAKIESNTESRVTTPNAFESRHDTKF